MLSTKLEILDSHDWDTEEFEVEKWGTVRIRSLTAKERLDLVRQFGSGNLSNDEAFGFYTRLLAMSLIDGDDKPLFTTDEDMQALQNKSWPRLQSVAEHIMEFNGMSGEKPGKN